MFKNFFSKFASSASHHQVIATILVGVSVICASWAIEKILEEHVWANKLSLRSYFLTIIVSVLFVWLAKHYILHVI